MQRTTKNVKCTKTVPTNLPKSSPRLHLRYGRRNSLTNDSSDLLRELYICGGQTLSKNLRSMQSSVFYGIRTQLRS